MSTHCYHCDLPILGKPDLFVEVQDVLQPMCCVGCQTVAQMIVDNHLEDFYAYRVTPSKSQKDLIPPELLELSQFDNAVIQRKYTTDKDEHLKAIVLSIEGITCAACVWLLENHIQHLDPSIQFSVNLSTFKAELIWDNEQIALSTLLREIAKIGYKAAPYQMELQDQYYHQEQNKALKRLAVSGFGFGQVMMFSIPLYAFFSQGIPHFYRDFFRLVTLIVTTPILFYCGWPFFKNAWRHIKHGAVTMDTSISIALLAIFGASIHATLMKTSEVYFDSITMLLFFVTLSRYLEMRIRYRSRLALQRLNRQLPNWVTRIANEQQEVVPLEDIQINDSILIKAGETVPIDGVVLHGTTMINEAVVTGEFQPKHKCEGDRVISGSLNVDHPIQIKVTQIGEQTTLASIIRLFERAQLDKPKLVSMAEQLAHYFVLCQLTISLVIFLAWAPYSIEHAFTLMITLLVICCPCALALATPIALTASMNALSALGFLCTRSHVVEGMAQATDFVFDKTGTLTEGQFSLDQIEIFSHGYIESEVMNIVAALEASSEHPIASAFKSIQTPYIFTDIKIYPNKGIEGQLQTERYYIGQKQYISECLGHNIKIPQSKHDSTEIFLANSVKLIARLTLSDTLKPNVQMMIQNLLGQGYQVHLLSGDNQNVVQSCSARLGIKQFKAECKPEDKLNYVKVLQNQGKVVVALGDGINDAPLLMQSQVSIAMGNAVDISRINADAILMQNDPMILSPVLEHVCKTQRIIRQCLAWAICYNVCSIPLAIYGAIQPWLAGILMSSSSIVVVLNASRLMRISARKTDKKRGGFKWTWSFS